MSYPTIEAIENALRSDEKLSVRDLYTIWEQRQPVSTSGKNSHGGRASLPTRGAHLRWMQSDLSLVTAFTAQAIHKEEFLLASDAFAEAAAFWKTQQTLDAGEWVKLHADHATAQMRLGFLPEARRGLEPMLADPQLGRRERAKILLQLGDILREQSHHTPTTAESLHFAEEAQRQYQKALELDPTLIEASVLHAAMALIVSKPNTTRRRQAADLGREVYGRLEQLARDQGETFRTAWFQAVALCIMGRKDEAAAAYARLKDFPDATTSALAEARYRAQFLAEAMGESRDFFKRAFPPLQLIIFAGHVPGADGMRFPPAVMEEVRALLRTKLDAMQARVGMTSASAGGNLLFIEALQQRAGSKYHLVLPWSQDEYRRSCVEPYDRDGEAGWCRLFDQAMEHSATVRELGQVFEPSDPVGWQFTHEVISGMALLTARILRLDVQPLALWDGSAGGEHGTTANFVDFWTHYLGHSPIILPLPRTSGTGGTPSTVSTFSRSERQTMHQEVKSMLFADIVGYSKLTEKVISDFVEIFMQRVSYLLSESRHAPRYVNTWGDALFAVFDYAEDAGRFALQLTKMIHERSEEWIKQGLFYMEDDLALDKKVRRPLDIRIGLHTGPVYAHYNPVLRQLGYTGSHVSRAARIEPVTAAGEVFASEEFAAMAELGAQIRLHEHRKGGAGVDHGEGFLCEYAGSMNLAKGYPGRFRIYRVVPQRLLALDELAMAAHALYCQERMRLGESKKDVPALRPWSELGEDLRAANRAQVADIPNKLRFLGYELAPSHGISPSALQMTDRQREQLAIREHQRWMSDRHRHGWTHGPERDNGRKLHPLLIPWEALSESEKQKDRDAVDNMQKYIEQAGFLLRPLAADGL